MIFWGCNDSICLPTQALGTSMRSCYGCQMVCRQNNAACPALPCYKLALHLACLVEAFFLLFFINKTINNIRYPTLLWDHRWVTWLIGLCFLYGSTLFVRDRMHVSYICSLILNTQGTIEAGAFVHIAGKHERSSSSPIQLLGRWDEDLRHGRKERWTWQTPWCLQSSLLAVRIAGSSQVDDTKIGKSV